MNFGWPPDAATTALAVTLLGKSFIMLADSMPPPPANCGYWQRWIYDFMQRVASNSAKVGTTKGDTIRDTGTPPESKLKPSTVDAAAEDQDKHFR